MILISEMDCLKASSELQADLIPGGVLYLIVEGDTFTWRKASKEFDLDIFQIGQKLNENSIAGRAIKEKKRIVQNVPRSLYGMRLRTVAEPIFNENGDCVGAFSVVFPLLHPIVKAFNDFAPILAEMFSEGAVIFVTDLQKIMRIQSSKKFKVDYLKEGKMLGDGSLAKKVLQAKKPMVEEVHNNELYGMPVMVTSYPIFDVENQNEIVGSIGIIAPKKIAGDLRGISESMESGLTGISAAIEQLASSASTIHANEQALNSEINEVSSLAEEIDELSYFIKKIAGETKMLGLNASIEAARAGEAGKGFGVVAQQIGKLSEQSKETVPKIKKLTDEIKKKAEELSEMSKSSLTSSQEQAAATEEVTASIEELTAMSEELNKMAQKL
ncbi:methyl-accepting chemotaxis protein [Clostridium hydrogenum]|uniref:methyl-accepting chemotaxis protein n=1 Tax=Clostridium hydrogenum TaxID=2855764 RepID=UPI001F21A02C|nr:methyl-accepting chemotaxis protein [Clostridium hydrogenum]